MLGQETAFKSDVGLPVSSPRERSHAESSLSSRSGSPEQVNGYELQPDFSKACLRSKASRLRAKRYCSPSYRDRACFVVQQGTHETCRHPEKTSTDT